MTTYLWFFNLVMSFSNLKLMELDYAVYELDKMSEHLTDSQREKVWGLIDSY